MANMRSPCTAGKRTAGNESLNQKSTCTPQGRPTNQTQNADPIKSATLRVYLNGPLKTTLCLQISGPRRSNDSSRLSTVRTFRTNRRRDDRSDSHFTEIFQIWYALHFRYGTLLSHSARHLGGACTRLFFFWGSSYFNSSLWNMPGT